MTLTKLLVVVLILSTILGFAVLNRRKRRHLFFAAHSIEAEQLHGMLFAGEPAGTVVVIDVRQPLDLLAYSQIIPGARRIAPKEIIENPALLPKDQDTVVYCTCPSNKTSIKIMQRAMSLGYEKVKFLHGGLEAWKEKGYPVEPYQTAFHLDTPA